MRRHIWKVKAKYNGLLRMWHKLERIAEEAIRQGGGIKTTQKELHDLNIKLLGL